MNQKKYESIRQQLHRSCVGIAGIGGLGSHAAVSLARAGVGTLVLADFDTVEKSNLHRQHYFLHQVGMKKVDALEENISNIDAHVKVKKHDVKLEPGSMEKPFKDVDIVIEALDAAETKTIFIEEIQVKLPEKPLVGASGVAGYGHSERITTIHHGNLYLCYDENAPSSEDDVLIGPRVALMGNWEANLAVEILLGEKL